MNKLLPGLIALALSGLWLALVPPLTAAHPPDAPQILGDWAKPGGIRGEVPRSPLSGPDFGPDSHPLDEFYQATYIIVAPRQVTFQIELYPGVLVAPQLLPVLDPDRDDEISEAEAEAYVARFIDDLTVEVDGHRPELTASHLDFPPVLAIRAGQAIIRFDLQAGLPPDQVGEPGKHHLYYENNHRPEVGVYVVNALVDSPESVRILKQDRDLFQSSLTLEYMVTSESASGPEVRPAASGGEGTAGITPGQERLNRYLYASQLSPLFLAAALGLAVVLGGLHALTPGHGKTLVAAYLIGSRGTVGHAVTLGGIVTFTHTASVIAIGLLALLASQFIVPNLLAPALEILSGLLVLYLGLRLLRSRWQAYRRRGRPHSFAHEHNEPEHHHHHHHHHHHDLPEKVTLGDLLTLGISGGLVPCPEALGIMLIAIGLNRILLGLGLIVAFSFGLAAILIIIGILLVRSKSLLDGLGQVGMRSARWQTMLPLVSAVIVTGLGLAIVIKGLLPYLRG